MKGWPDLTTPAAAEPSGAGEESASTGSMPRPTEVARDPGPTDADLVQAVRSGNMAAFEELMRRYGPRVFATVRRYARRDSEVADLAQEIWIKAFQKLSSFRGEAPFEHWLMRLAVRACYDALRAHRRSREATFTDLTEAEQEWLMGLTQTADDSDRHRSEAARQLVDRLLEQLSPADRLVLTLLELEERSVKETAELTGWSVTTVKVRAFRARARMRRLLSRLMKEKFL